MTGAQAGSCAGALRSCVHRSCRGPKHASKGWVGAISLSPILFQRVTLSVQ